MRHKGSTQYDRPRAGWLRRRSTAESANVSGPTQAVTDATVQRWWRYRHYFLEAKRLVVEDRLHQARSSSPRASATGSGAGGTT